MPTEPRTTTPPELVPPTGRQSSNTATRAGSAPRPMRSPGRLSVTCGGQGVGLASPAYVQVANGRGIATPRKTVTSVSVGTCLATIRR
jgi:hypothetical protein